MAVKVEKLADAVMEGLTEYAGAVAEDIKAAAATAATDCVSELKKTSPKDTGSYRKGWKKTKAYESSTEVRYTVHNATDGQITHLLEFGHAKRNGGRVEAIPHIAEAERNAIETMEKKAKEACSK